MGEYRTQLMQSTARIRELLAEEGEKEEEVREGLEEELFEIPEEDLSSEFSSDEEEEEGLMSGALSERIQILRNRCTEALTAPVFLSAYGYIKGMREEHNCEFTEQVEKEMEIKLEAMVGPSKMGYVKLVEQLL